MSITEPDTHHLCHTFVMRQLLLFLLLVIAPLRAAEIALPDAKNATRQPLVEARQRKAKAVVFLFITNECPIANRYAPEINRIVRDYEKRGVQFFLVHADAQLKAAEAAAHAKEYKLTAPVLLDRKHELVKLTGASVTPEAAVLSPQGKLLYRGRIDDSYARWGQQRPQPTQRDLRLALDAIVAGKNVPVSRTKAIGCYIENIS